MGFLEGKKMSSATATRRRVEWPKTKSAKVFDGLLFWYLIRLLVETKKLLTTDISKSVFISSSRWEAVNFPLERSRPISGRIKINNAQCITVSANGSLNKGTSPETNARAIHQKEKQTLTTEITMLTTVGIVLLPRPVCPFFHKFDT